MTLSRLLRWFWIKPFLKIFNKRDKDFKPPKEKCEVKTKLPPFLSIR